MGQTEWCKNTRLLHRFTWSCSVIPSSNTKITKLFQDLPSLFIMHTLWRYGLEISALESCLRELGPSSTWLILLSTQQETFISSSPSLYLGVSFSTGRNLTFQRKAMKWDTFKDDYFVAVETGTNGHLWQTQATRFV